MTTCLGKSCSFGLPSVAFVNVYQIVYFFLLLFLDGIWDSIVLVLDSFLSFYFLTSYLALLTSAQIQGLGSIPAGISATLYHTLKEKNSQTD